MRRFDGRGCKNGSGDNSGDGDGKPGDGGGKPGDGGGAKMQRAPVTRPRPAPTR
ncbi:MAG: hypothetical protein OXU98_02355 [Gammaproteobacteria bacterium]|nr:hypothetical protein [Gammaproteobacteria bacterium]